MKNKKLTIGGLMTFMRRNPPMNIAEPENAHSRDIQDTRAALQSEPTPPRIDRLKFANNVGNIGPRNFSRGFPVFQDTIRVGHIPTYVKTRKVVMQPGNGWDDTTFVSAPQSGNPLP
jgi:hypothetical protein